MERKERRDLIHCLNDYLDKLTVEKAIEYLKNKEKEILERQPIKNYTPYIKVILSEEYEPYSSKDQRNLYIVGIRLENDQEFNERMAQEKVWAKEQEARDLKLLETLKAKYKK